MEFTFKNRPVKATPQAYERWIKGLEKELRHRLFLLETIPKENKIWMVSYPLELTLKEILG